MNWERFPDRKLMTESYSLHIKNSVPIGTSIKKEDSHLKSVGAVTVTMEESWISVG